MLLSKLCPPPSKRLFWDHNPRVPQNAALFGNRVFADVVKMRSSGWVLTRYDWCPYKKGKFGHRHRHAHVKTEAEMGVMLP